MDHYNFMIVMDNTRKVSPLLIQRQSQALAQAFYGMGKYVFPRIILLFISP